MPAHRSHDRTRIQADRHDELTDGVPSHEQASASQERKAGGRGIGRGASLVPAMGGRALKGRTKLTHEVPDALPVSDALKARTKFARRRVCSEVARNQGGGQCGMIASLFIKLGLEDVAMREAALASGDIDAARKLGESARMHLLYGREAAAKDASTRPIQPTGILATMFPAKGRAE
jgi:hypothetical protein